MHHLKDEILISKLVHKDKVVNAEKQTNNIVCLIPRGEVIRNFVYSGTLQKVSDHSSLSLLAVAGRAGFNKHLEQIFGHINPLIEYDEKWLVRFQREIIDIAHGRWLWSRAAQERWRLRDMEAKKSQAKIDPSGKKGNWNSICK